MNQEYHKIYIPLTDAYDLGGPDVFTNFERTDDEKAEGEKNLIVFPWSFIDSLDKLKETSPGAEKTLEKICEVSKGKKICESADGFDFYKCLEGLDIAIVGEGNDSSDKFIASLYEQIEAQFTKAPVLITSQPRPAIYFARRGMNVEEPEFLKVGEDILNEGILAGNDELISELFGNSGVLPLETAAKLLGREEKELYHNQFIRFVWGQSPARYARVAGKLRWNKEHTEMIGVEDRVVRMLAEQEYGKKIRIGQQVVDNVLGISPKDMEQYIAMQYGLFNPEVSLFFICGSQGSGKTLLSYVAAVDMVLVYEEEMRRARGLDGDKKEGFFRQIILIKPNNILGGKSREVGYLPGDLYAKIKPHLGPFIDAHKESVLGQSFPFEEMFKHPRFVNDFGMPRTKEMNGMKINGARLTGHCEMIELTYSGFMRGRSLKDTLLMIDEGQNLTPFEMKTLLSRLGMGCKCVVMGDPKQIDNPACRADFNGLTHAVNHYLRDPFSMVVKLPKNYRDQISKRSDDRHAY